NPQTKAIAGVDVPYHYHYYTALPSHHFYSGPCTADTLEIAKENLSRHFSLVGLTERFEETLALAKVLFGWKIPYYTSVRRSPKRAKKDVTSQQRTLIAEYHKFDMALYSFGVSLFNRAIGEHADRLSLALDSIRRANNPGAIRSVY